MSGFLSVIVSTYNRPGALRLVLEGYARSSSGAFEVIVADDGSTDETGDVVAEAARRSGFPIRHVRQEHRGFRLAAARNLAVRAASGDVFLFTDGDCIPFPDSLDEPSARCRPGQAVTGDRCLLSREETERLLPREARVEDLFAAARRRDRGRLRALRWKNRFYGWTGLKARPKLLTANAAVHRADFERVNGFDERFVGWGYEDEDLARRLRRAGVRILDASLESLVLHLFHPIHESHRPSARHGENYRYFRQRSFLTRPLLGLSTRKVEDLSIGILGDAPPCLGEIPRSGGSARHEVTVVFGTRRASMVRPEGEVILHLPAQPPLESLAELHEILRAKL
ncbi:MAG TPA: glycosyltransferase [Planctomycetota bacterium]|nr:glycosyltransferase [Planctomycetota bacterium]